MKIEYSKEDDALCITLKEADVVDTDELTEDIIDYDNGGIIEDNIIRFDEKTGLTAGCLAQEEHKFQKALKKDPIVAETGILV